MDTLNKIAPIKKRHVPSNQMSFMTKELSKEIMARLRLRNNSLIDKTDENRFLYTLVLPTNCLSVFGHFVGLELKGLTISQNENLNSNIENIKDQVFGAILKFKNYRVSLQ